MKQLILTIVLVATANITMAAEVANGAWSTELKIQEIVSNWSSTNFKLGGSDGCGNVGDGWWKLASTASTEERNSALKYKKSILLAAAASSKIVKLRCENGAISDFSVKF